MATDMGSSSSSLRDRIIRAIKFDSSVYAEVEHDAAFTQTAWLLVVVITVLNQLGARATTNIGSWIGGVIVGSVLRIIAFAVGVYVISWVGKRLFDAEVSFDEMVRTLGLAYVWNVIGIVGALAAFSAALVCVLSPALFIGLILGLIAWFVATKEALDLDWGPTIVTVVVGWVALLIITLITSPILGLLGLATGA